MYNDHVVASFCGSQDIESVSAKQEAAAACTRPAAQASFPFGKGSECLSMSNQNTFVKLQTHSTLQWLCRQSLILPMLLASLRSATAVADLYGKAVVLVSYSTIGFLIGVLAPKQCYVGTCTAIWKKHVAHWQLPPISYICILYNTRSSCVPYHVQLPST